jgi:hypothetical protein
MAKHIGGDGLDSQDVLADEFECRTAVACHGTKLTLTAEGRAANDARACGTFAPLRGEQAAEGQTARLSQCDTPSCKTRGK